MTLNLKQFASSVCDVGLLSAEAIAQAQQDLPAARRPNDGEELAKELVRRGLLTTFQAANVLQGRGKNLVYGDYVVLDRIGAGGMGQVFKAEHRRMKRIVALKLLPPTAMKSPDAVTRFQREVQAAARLIHPNIVTAFDAGEAGGIHFLVMEYVEGRDLSAVVRQRGQLPLGEALDYILQAARGLAYAHEKGVIHRDIKPANLLVDRDGTLKILDMGLARLDDEPVAANQAELTQAGQVMGTLDYMAPEQAFNTHQADARADIYSLGCTLYRLLIGENMYRGDTAVQTILAHREQAVPVLRAKRPELPASLEDHYRRMVAKQPADRFQTMKEVIAALELDRPGAISTAGPAAPPPVSLAATRIYDPAAVVASPVASSERVTAGAGAPTDATLGLPQQVSGSAANPIVRLTSVVASEKSKNLVAKVVGGLFATIIAPILVTFLMKYLDSDSSAPNPPAAPVAGPQASAPGMSTRATSIKPAAAVPGDWIDLLSQVYLPLDTQGGPKVGMNHWERRADGIYYLPDGKNGRVRLPILVEGPDFEIECEFTLLEDGASFELIFPNGVSGTAMDFSLAEGVHVGKLLHPAFNFTKGKRTKVLVQMTKLPAAEPSASAEGSDVLSVHIEGQHSFRWQGHREKLSMPRLLGADGKSLTLFSREKAIAVHEYRFRMLEGLARPERLGPTPPLVKAPFDESSARLQRQAWAKYLGVPPELTNSQGVKMVLLPPGTFDMGISSQELELLSHTNGSPSAVELIKIEGPRHPVSINRLSYMATTETTIGQYRQFATAAPYKTPAENAKGKAKTWRDPGYATTDATPVTELEWGDAVAFCNWLSDQEKLPHAYDATQQPVPHSAGYRLPTEAEWEHACRAGTSTIWYFGDDPTRASEFAWVGVGPQISEGGKKKPNAFGLFDMSGNVWEWCQDWYAPDYYAKSPPVDPPGPETGLTHVLRGGSHNHPATWARSAMRHTVSKPTRRNVHGFRVVRGVVPAF